MSNDTIKHIIPYLLILIIICILVFFNFSLTGFVIALMFTSLFNLFFNKKS